MYLASVGKDTSVNVMAAFVMVTLASILSLSSVPSFVTAVQTKMSSVWRVVVEIANSEPVAILHHSNSIYEVSSVSISSMSDVSEEQTTVLSLLMDSVSPEVLSAIVTDAMTGAVFWTKIGEDDRLSESSSPSFAVITTWTSSPLKYVAFNVSDSASPISVLFTNQA